MAQTNVPLSASPWQGSYSSLPLNLYAKPKEGPRAVTAVISWVDYPAVLDPDNIVQNAVSFDLSGFTQLSQIGGVYIDNTYCTRSIAVYVKDTNIWHLVNASGTSFFPLLTGQKVLQFQTVDGAGDLFDKTSIVIVNEFFPPADLNNQRVAIVGQPLIVAPPITGQAVSGVLALPNAGTVDTILTVGNGSLYSFDVSVEAVASGAGASTDISIRDGTGVILWLTRFNAAAGVGINYQILKNASPLKTIFANNLLLRMTAVAGIYGSGGLNCNAQVGT